MMRPWEKHGRLRAKAAQGALTAVVCLWWSIGASGQAQEALLTAERDNVFVSFTAHIKRQIQTDKTGFAQAQTCTEWFYKQHRKKPDKPPAMGVAFRSRRPAAPQATQASDCHARYPGGLDAAREDFSRTQSALSLSLTFYEFALVGDGNDDGRYSAGELQDMLEAFGLSFRAGDTPAAHAALLNEQFDTVRKAGGLDVLMAGMSVLYDKGYRFTAPDRAALNRISG